jgi:hypothetical protein
VVAHKFYLVVFVRSFGIYAKSFFESGQNIADALDVERDEPEIGDRGGSGDCGHFREGAVEDIDASSLSGVQLRLKRGLDGPLPNLASLMWWVPAQVSASDLNPAPALAIVSRMLSRSRVDQASRSSRVIISTSQGSNGPAGGRVSGPAVAARPPAPERFGCEFLSSC